MTKPPPMPATRSTRGVIEIELDTYNGARKLFAEAEFDPMDAVVASYGVIEAAITDPDVVYNRRQLEAMITGLNRARRDHFGGER